MTPTFREMAERMDPVIEPDRLFGGDAHQDSDRTDVPLRRSRGSDDDFADHSDKGLRELHRFRPGMEADGVSFRTLAERHERGTISKVLFYNTWLLTGFKRLWAAKPDLASRSREIGVALEADEYNVMALSEVFESEERDRILKGVRQGGGAVASEIGPPAGADKSSGLCTVTVDRPITRMERIEYWNEGVRDRDADAWSNKGVLLTEIDLGPGRVDLYSTHALSGGGLEGVDVASAIVTLGASELIEDQTPAEIRDDQFEEAARFIRRTHHPENVAIFGGDFNIGADTSEYDTLLANIGDIEMAVVETDDGYVNLYPYLRTYLEEQARQADDEDSVWETIGGWLESAAGAVLGNVAIATDGITSLDELVEVVVKRVLDGHEEELARELGIPVETYTMRMRDLWRSRGGNVGSTTHKKSAIQRRCTFDSTAAGPHYCDDYARADTYDASRIDYVFLADPNPYQTVDIDASRMRRRPFPRSDHDADTFWGNSEDEEDPHYLSDHLGLELTLVASRPD